MNEISQGEIFLVAEENPRILVIWKVFVGEKLLENPRRIKMVLIAMMFDARIEAITSVSQ